MEGERPREPQLQVGCAQESKIFRSFGTHVSAFRAAACSTISSSKYNFYPIYDGSHVPG